MYKLGILGLGKMGSSILNGILKKNVYKKEDIFLCLHPDNLNDYKDKGFNYTLDYNELFNNAETILLSVKPQVFNAEIKPLNNDFKDKKIISIMAGIKIETIENLFNGANIARIMPNTPALIGKAVSTYALNKENKELENIVVNIFNSIGVAYKITEDFMDQTLPLNGSMPAYIDLFMKAFVDRAVSYGIDKETAKGLCANSVISSAYLYLESKEDIQTLIDNVCSKGGTTIAGLNKLYDNDFEKAIYECYDACVNRSIELSKK